MSTLTRDATNDATNDATIAKTATIDAAAVDHGLKNDIGSWRPLVYGDETDSTNSDVRRAQADTKGLRGSWVLALADAQRDGRGRLGHGWFSPPGCAVHMSLGAELSLPAPLWPRASLIVGAAAAEVIGEMTGVDIRLKWPNDLLVRHEGGWRKAGGILCERHEPTDAPPLWIGGIGVNVSIPVQQFPEPLRPHVASLSWLGPPPDRGDLALRIALAVRRAIDFWERAGGELNIEAIRARAVFIGDVISVDLGDGGQPQRMRLVDIGADGGLVVTPPAGGQTSTIAPLQIVAAQTQPPWQAPPRLPR